MQPCRQCGFCCFCCSTAAACGATAVSSVSAPHSASSRAASAAGPCVLRRCVSRPPVILRASYPFPMNFTQAAGERAGRSNAKVLGNSPGPWRRVVRGTWRRKSSKGGAGVVGGMGWGGAGRDGVGVAAGTVAPMQRYVVSKEQRFRCRGVRAMLMRISKASGMSTMPKGAGWKV